MRLLIPVFLFFVSSIYAQTSSIYEKLPVGKYAVGFKIFTITDPSRIAKPEYDYLGEKIKGDRRKKITVHLWYPAKLNTGKRKMVYADYCYNRLLTSTSIDTLSKEQKNAEINDSRSSVERWFGKTNDVSWKALVETPMLASLEAAPVSRKFPLLVGVLRPLSTTISNEMLASNGFIVAMVKGNDGSFAESTLSNIPDMRMAIAELERNGYADAEAIGTFGFSGSGFSQVLFAMNDYRIKAVADIESGIYMDGLFQGFSASNYYAPYKLRIPFLHIFSRDLSKQEKFINEFENKAKFSNRYRLLLNQPALHHWDFATEGYISCTVLKMRGAERENIRQSFEIASVYLLNFFNAQLKGDEKSLTFLTGKTSLPQVSSSLWDIMELKASVPAPDIDQFKDIADTKGIDEAVAVVKRTIRDDTLSNITEWYNLNSMGYRYLQLKKYKEAVETFRLNTELHPLDPNLFDSLAEAYELSGEPENMKKVSGIVLELLNKKEGLSDADKGLKGNAEKRLAAQGK